MSTREHIVIISQRNQPTELHFPDGSTAVLEPRGRLTVSATLRGTPQLLALERERAVRVMDVVAGPRVVSAAGPAEEAEDEGSEDADDGSDKSRGKSKRTRTK